MNYYAIIIGAFIVAGLIITAFGWRALQKSKATKLWPSVNGEISEARLASAEDDLLPDIRFSYTVDSQHYQGRLEFPPGTMPIPGFAQNQLGKYPLGCEVSVYYNPLQPDQATLEPGRAGDDWLLLAIGISSAVIGLLAMFFSG